MSELLSTGHEMGPQALWGHFFQTGKGEHAVIKKNWHSLGQEVVCIRANF